MTAHPTRKAQTPAKITLPNGRHPDMTMPFRLFDLRVHAISPAELGCAQTAARVGPSPRAHRSGADNPG
jgi:hypothetical protein